MESEQIYSSIYYKQNTELYLQSDFKILEKKEINMYQSLTIGYIWILWLLRQ